MLAENELPLFESTAAATRINLDNTLKCTEDQILFKKGLLQETENRKHPVLCLAHYLTSQPESEWPYMLKTSKMLFLYRLYKQLGKQTKFKTVKQKLTCSPLIFVSLLSCSLDSFHGFPREIKVN